MFSDDVDMQALTCVCHREPAAAAMAEPSLQQYQLLPGLLNVNSSKDWRIHVLEHMMMHMPLLVRLHYASKNDIQAHDCVC